MTLFDFGIMVKYNDEAMTIPSKGLTLAITFDTAGKI